MEGQYILFAGDTYYPGGGWDDFIGRFETKEAAYSAAAELNEDWFQVVDINANEELFA